MAEPLAAYWHILWAFATAMKNATKRWATGEATCKTEGKDPMASDATGAADDRLVKD